MRDQHGDMANLTSERPNCTRWFPEYEELQHSHEISLSCGNLMNSGFVIALSMHVLDTKNISTTAVQVVHYRIYTHVSDGGNRPGGKALHAVHRHSLAKAISLRYRLIL